MHSWFLLGAWLVQRMGQLHFCMNVVLSVVFYSLAVYVQYLVVVLEGTAYP